MTRRLSLRLLAVLTAAVIVGGAGGCAARQSPTQTAVLPASPTTSAAPVQTTPASGSECVGGVARISGSDLDIAFAAACERLEVEGNDLDIDLRDADVTEVVVRGDRNEVDAEQARAVGALSIEGMDNEWDGAALGSLSIRGDRNEIELDGEIGAVAVSGNDNSVTAVRFGAIDDAGERNTYPTR